MPEATIDHPVDVTETSAAVEVYQSSEGVMVSEWMVDCIEGNLATIALADPVRFDADDVWAEFGI